MKQSIHHSFLRISSQLFSKLGMRLILGMISAYQVLHQSFYSGCCRFHPTCSEYAREAIGAHGLWTGTGLTFKRILKCHPFSKGGIDFVPTTNGNTKNG